MAQALPESDHGTADGGHGRGDLADLRETDGLAERRIGEHLPEIGDETSLLALGEDLHVDTEDGVDPEQHRHGERPLVLLESWFT